MKRLTNHVGSTWHSRHIWIALESQSRRSVLAVWSLTGPLVKATERLSRGSSARGIAVCDGRSSWMREPVSWKTTLLWWWWSLTASAGRLQVLSYDKPATIGEGQGNSPPSGTHDAAVSQAPAASLIHALVTFQAEPPRLSKPCRSPSTASYRHGKQPTSFVAV